MRAGERREDKLQGVRWYFGLIGGRSMFLGYRTKGARGARNRYLKYINPPVPTLPTVKLRPSLDVACASISRAAARLTERSRSNSLLFFTWRRELFLGRPKLSCEVT